MGRKKGRISLFYFGLGHFTLPIVLGEGEGLLLARIIGELGPLPNCRSGASKWRGVACHACSCRRRSTKNTPKRNEAAKKLRV